MSLESQPGTSTKAQYQEESHINTLPDEVLCMIFDSLDFECLKSASLACQRWNNVIFLSEYVKRFALRICLYLYPCELWKVEYVRRNAIEENRPIELIKEFKAIVAKSQRRYRHFFLYTEEQNDGEFVSVWETIHPKLTSHLHSLKFEGEDSSKMLPLIADPLPLMSKLRSLTLIDKNIQYSIQDIIPTLRSNYLKDLHYQSTFKCQLEMPNLQTFYGALSAFLLPIDIAQPFPLSNLKHVTVWENDILKQDRSMIKAAISVFRRLTHLETMHWTINIPNEVFLKLCETCTTLKELHFLRTIDLSDENDINLLSKLTNLRVLAMNSCEIDLSSITHIEEIRLKVDKYIWKLPNSLKKLTMAIYGSDPNIIIRGMFNSCRQLSILEVDNSLWFAMDYETLGTCYQIFEALPLLKHLEVLIISHSNVEKKDFLSIHAPMNRLRKLQFNKCNILTDGTTIYEKFPNLTELNFVNCTSITNLERKELEEKDLDAIYGAIPGWYD